jgi:hypothetical protein
LLASIPTITVGTYPLPRPSTLDYNNEFRNIHAQTKNDGENQKRIFALLKNASKSVQAKVIENYFSLE